MNYVLIKDLAEQKGLTVKKLCEEVGITDAGLHQMIRNESMKIEILEKISEVLNIPVSTFFSESSDSSSSKYIGQFKKANIIQNNIGGQIDLSKNSDKALIKKTEEFLLLIKELESKLSIAESKIKELEGINNHYWDTCNAMTDHITSLLINIVKADEKMLHFITEQDETRRFIAQINTIERMSERKIIFNKKFFEYFENPYI